MLNQLKRHPGSLRRPSSTVDRAKAVTSEEIDPVVHKAKAAGDTSGQGMNTVVLKS